ncbi:MAG: CoA transferase [Lautropia sp.]
MGTAALPLQGLRFAAAPWPAARSASLLLQMLGGEADGEAISESDATHLALRAGDATVHRPPTTTEQDWQASGIAGLTGRRAGPALRPPGEPATLARAALLAVELLRQLPGQSREHASQAVQAPTQRRASLDAGLLGQRAALLGLQRGGDISANGSARLLPTRDGWFALNLPRGSDVELVPALVESPPTGDPWSTVAQWAHGRGTREVVERAMLLGLAVATARPRPPRDAARQYAPRAPWTFQPEDSRPCTEPRRLRVVNLGSLWAAPLCAQMLRHCGMGVVDVQSVHRLEDGPEPFYSLLHADHVRDTCDFSSAAGRERLRSLLHEADVVIEASRARALRSLGADASRIQGDGRPRVWIRITGHGYGSDRIAFGDDAAVEGGLVAWDAAGPVFVGDAITDPLTGLLAAVAALACAHSGRAWTVDVGMTEVARLAAAS